jgi:hypothetical protein
MYLLTYVGALLNGLTLLIVAWVGLFSAPRLYRYLLKGDFQSLFSSRVHSFGHFEKLALLKARTFSSLLKSARFKKCELLKRAR